MPLMFRTLSALRSWSGNGRQWNGRRINGGDRRVTIRMPRQVSPHSCHIKRQSQHEIFLNLLYREKFAMLFEHPVLLQANNVYLAWARISGPSSDCGSSGQMMVKTEDQWARHDTFASQVRHNSQLPHTMLSYCRVVFKFKNSRKSNNGTTSATRRQRNAQQTGIARTCACAWTRRSTRRDHCKSFYSTRPCCTYFPTCIQWFIFVGMFRLHPHSSQLELEHFLRSFSHSRLERRQSCWCHAWPWPTCACLRLLKVFIAETWFYSQCKLS